ncbi:MAG: tetratricopeptide repeat protein [Bacteroidota bacterium]
MKLRIVLIIGVFFLVASLRVQASTEIDSLQQLLAAAPPDTNRVLIQCDLAWEQKFDYPDAARQNLREALAFAKSIDYLRGQGQALNFLGVVETIHDDYEAAIQHYEAALVIRQSLGDKSGVASIYNNIGNLYESLDDYPKALENLRNSLAIRKELKDTLRIARASANIGIVYEERGDYTEALSYILDYLSFAERLQEKEEIANAYNLLGNIKTELERFDEALEHYEAALGLRQDMDDDYALASIYNNMGNIFDDLGERSYKAEDFDEALPKFQSALSYHERALALRKQLEDTEGIADSYNNMGVLHKNWGSYYLELEQQPAADAQFDKAMSYLNEALRIREDSEDKAGLIEVYNSIGDVKRRQELLDEALDYTKRYLKLSKAIDDKKFEQKAYKDLSRVYADLKDYKKAYKNRKKYDELRYERLDEKRIKDNARREAVYADHQKQLQIEKLEKDNAVALAEKQQANFYRNILFLGVLFLAIIAILVLNQNRLKTRSNKELAAKNAIIELERQRSDDLLLNILPAQTAKELKAQGKAKARRHESVTVLFADIKSFTKIAEALGPEALVHELDQYFRQFDAITARYGIEKIKTIGDAYMCVAGLSGQSAQHAADMVRAARELLQYAQSEAQKRETKGLPHFEIRIGIHTGPVISGVVGSHKLPTTSGEIRSM